MTSKGMIYRNGLVVLVAVLFSACGASVEPFAETTGLPDPAAQGASVQVIPAVAELVSAARLPFTALVTSTVDTGVIWEVTEAGGGSIDSTGVYTAPQSLGTYHVVARSRAVPAASATAAVTVSPAPQLATGRAIGANLSWWTYWDEQAFADTARQGNYRSTAGGMNIPTDALGWPTTDFKIYFGTYTPGTYKVSFTGQANVTAFGSTSIQNQSYDAATNTTNANLVVPAAPTSGLSQLSFTATKRQASDAASTGLTNLKIMRPGLATDNGTAATRFEPNYVAAIQTLQWFRAMQSMGPAGTGIMGNSDVHWSEADAISAGVPTYQAGASYAFGQTVRNNGKTYMASFASGTMSGTAGSNAPNHNSKVNYDSGGPADGAVHWGRATRVLPFGCGDDGAGPAWEDIIMLANRSRVSPWFTIPFFASDLYVTKFARLIRFGSDASGEPYTSPQATPFYPPLDPALPFIVEWSNEIWNSYPYPANVNTPLATAEYGSGNPWKYTTTDVNVRAIERSAMLAVRMSILFRQVFGDGEMMTRVRPVWAGQIGYGSGAAGQVQYMAPTAALKYVTSVWGPSSAFATINGQPNPKQAANYYLYGIAGAPYNDWSGTTSDALFASWNSRLAGLKTALENWDLVASTNGMKTLTYEGGNQMSSAAITVAQGDPRYQTALTDLVHAFWQAPRGTSDVYAHFRLSCSANNSGLGYPAAAPYGNGNYLSSYLATIVDRKTPGWDAMRALRAETGR